MKTMHRLAGAGALAVGMMAATAQAAPITSASLGMKAAAGEATAIEKVATHRCGRNGRKLCQYYGDPYYPFGRYGYAYGFTMFEYYAPRRWEADRRPYRR